MYTEDSIDIYPTVNTSVVEAEKKGYAHQLVQRHRTTIDDPSIRAEIKKISTLEVIS